MFFHAGFHRRSRAARRVIIFDRVSANLLVVVEVGGVEGVCVEGAATCLER